MTPQARDLHGVFIGAHAIAAGAASRRQLHSGLFRRVLHGVYADPGIPLTHELVCRAAALLMPGHAVLGGRSAAAWWGAPFAGPRDRVLVVVPVDSPWRGPQGVHVHRSTLDDRQIAVVDAEIRVTDPRTTAWGVATMEQVSDAVAYLDGMLRAGHLHSADITELQAYAVGRWRGQRARRALSLADGRAQSPPESWVRVACSLAGLPPPVPQFVVVTNGTFLGAVDLAWPDAKLIVEYEGEYHFDELQIRKDDRRYDRLVAAGWRVIRLSASDLRDMASVLARIRAALSTALPAS